MNGYEMGIFNVAPEAYFEVRLRVSELCTLYTVHCFEQCTE
jgi:hypothetical protein